MNQEKLQGSLEIQNALKELEIPNAEQAPKAVDEVSTHEVEGIKFESDSWKALKFYQETIPPKIVQLVMKCSGGLIKEENQASYILSAFAVVLIIISLFLFFGDGRPKMSSPPGSKINSQFEGFTISPN